MTSTPITAGMVLAAGFGTRIKEVNPMLPKPLLPISGRTLLDNVISYLIELGIDSILVNVHYKTNLIRNHLESRHYNAKINISYEEELLDTGGGILKAIREYNTGPILVIKSDLLIIKHETDNPLKALLHAWDENKMGALLLLHPNKSTDKGDFALSPAGRIIRGINNPYTYTGACIISPELFKGRHIGKFSLSSLWFQSTAEKFRDYTHYGIVDNINGYEDLGTVDNYLKFKDEN